MIEALIIGGSAVFVWSLWLGGAVGKRKKPVVKTEVKYIEKIITKEAPSNPNKPKIHPFVGVFVNTICPICGAPARAMEGLRLPKACTRKLFPNCYTKEDHVHVECTLCTATFLMAPAYSKR
jgi:hypothetical protein